MRPEELVRRAHEEVDAGRFDVDRAMRAVVDRVHPRERACFVREVCDASNVRDRPDGVRGPGESDDASPLRELAFEIVHVDRAVLLVQVGEADHEAEVARQLEPGGDVAVMVESRAEDLVARTERACGGAREREVERRHVRTEAAFLRQAAEEARRRGVGFLDDRVRAPARLVGASDVRVRLPQVAGDRLDDAVGALRSAGAVEERRRPAECGEPRPHGGDVECDSAHRPTFGL
jgi:hypothetical protein